MKYRPFASTGWDISVIGLGGVPLSFASRPDEAAAVDVIHHALGCGINVIDTADAYCRDGSETGHNERLIAKALALLPASERQSVRVLTKGGYTRPGSGWAPDGRPEHLRSACEGSLARLGAESIDLYQHHTPDPDVPIEETIGALAELRSEGKIRHIGVSNYSVEQIDIAQSIVEIASVQNQYSPRHRVPESDGTLAATGTRNLAFLPWSPLGGMGGAKTLDRGLDALRAVGADHGTGPHRVALAWLLAKGPHVFPIPGASRRETIEDSALAADLVLGEAEIALLDRSL
ncbi:MAG: aldo/keto reductase [Acidobacteriota bacterium]|nr:aldo/keto reductase [Acidobacteriota bacterium]